MAARIGGILMVIGSVYFAGYANHYWDHYWYGGPTVFLSALGLTAGALITIISSLK